MMELAAWLRDQYPHVRANVLQSTVLLRHQAVTWENSRCQIQVRRLIAAWPPTCSFRTLHVLQSAGRTFSSGYSGFERTCLLLTTKLQHPASKASQFPAPEIRQTCFL